jgi:hypothetical protein
MKERDYKKQPQIIADLNSNLGSSEMTVEGIAEKLGISKTSLYTGFGIFNFLDIPSKSKDLNYP